VANDLTMARAATIDGKAFAEGLRARVADKAAAFEAIAGRKARHRLCPRIEAIKIRPRARGRGKEDPGRGPAHNRGIFVELIRQHGDRSAC